MTEVRSNLHSDLTYKFIVNPNSFNNLVIHTIQNGITIKADMICFDVYGQDELNYIAGIMRDEFDTYYQRERLEKWFEGTV